MKIPVLIGMVVLFSGFIGVAFAQSNHIINIPSGASDPSAPYFWQVERDGSTTGDIQIKIDDTVKWENADTAPHTVTSGTPETGPDDLFDSGLFSPGQTFQFTFDELGEYPYFCIVHPWMIGNVIVTEGLSVLPKVGSQVDDGKTTFDLEYGFNRLLDNPSINVEQKSVTFELIGNAKSQDHTLYLKIPSALLDGPYVVWVDGGKLADFEHEKQNDMNNLTIPLSEKNKVLTIVGTKVIPEFGVLSMAILAMAVISVIVLSQKSRFQIRF